jgi:glycosyltransferase involved in cell wall biosynthesis
MKIGFDAKRAISNFTGLGNYSRFVISNLMKYHPDGTYKLFIEKFPTDDRKDLLNYDKSDYIVKHTRKPFWRTYGIIQDIRKENPDIYHGLSGELPYRINYTGTKSVVTIHDLIFLKFPQFYPVIDRIIYNIKAKYACKIADRIIAVSECTKKDIIKYYHINPEKIEVVYQGCFPVFKQRESSSHIEEIKKKYNLPSEFLLSVGSIEERKNILLIVKALKNVPDIHFVAIGKQRKYAEKVLAYASQHGLSDRVHLISNVPLTDLPAIFQSCRIFIYPSLYEGFGIPIIEALNSGVPVIGATGSCLEEAGGPNSIYVNPYDESELAEQINRLLADNSLRETMIKEGHKYAERFSDEECTNAIYNVYKELVEQT